MNRDSAFGRLVGRIAPLVASLLLVCGGCGGGGDGTPPAANPTIASFTAAKYTVTEGTSTTLTAVFSGGAGVISNSVGAVTSGVSASTGTLTTTTTFILTVTNAVGVSATSTVTVSVVPGPAITEFTAAKSYVTSGSGTNLSHGFSGGSGNIDQGIGNVASGGTTNVMPVATTTYTLTVTNAAGTVVSKSITVNVVPAPTVASFSASPATVAPGGSATLTGVFANGVGTVDQSVGTVTSGAGVNTGALAATTIYTLTVTNPAGDTVTAITTVNVVHFALTGSLATPRRGHTATMLQDGRVLVVGGTTSGSPVDAHATAELYDPGSGAFTASGSMSAARVSHAATLLQSGKVLISGGLTPSGSATSSELYDPASGTFSPTGPLLLARWGHTATKLADGRVLIVGGALRGSASDVPVPDEIYNPANGSFAYTGPRTGLGPLAGHTATLLQNGNVLIAGGYDGEVGSSTQSAAHIYESATGAFRAITPMGARRAGNTATLLADGRVLIAGGPYNLGQSTAELFDPVTETFAATGSMKALSTAATATRLLNGKVLVTGTVFGGQLRFLAETYDPSVGSFTTVGPLLVPRETQYTATLLPSGKVLMVGGLVGSSDATSSAEVYE